MAHSEEADYSNDGRAADIMGRWAAGNGLGARVAGGRRTGPFRIVGLVLLLVGVAGGVVGADHGGLGYRGVEYGQPVGKALGSKGGNRVVASGQRRCPRRPGGE